VSRDVHSRVLLEAGEADLIHRVVRRSDGQLSLTTKEAELLRYLADHVGEDLSRGRLLEEVWGYRSGVASRTADTTVQRLRVKIELDPSNPKHLLTVHGLGYRFEPRAGSATAPLTPDSAADSASRSQHNLRPEHGPFVGRSAELAALEELLDQDSQVVTLLGPAGAGKTRLAREVARTLAATGRFTGGVWFCDLTEARDTSGVLRVVGQVLDVPLGSSDGLRDPVERLGKDLLERGPTLLVLDNVEQVVEVSAPLFARWVDALPDTRFLLTSRERVRIGPERVLELSPLDEASAVELFTLRAAAARPDLDVDGVDRAALQQIVERLDNLPLAIELVAPRLAVLTPAGILKRLDDRFRLATSTRRDLPSRQRTLRAALDWSWDLLTSAEQTALAQCSVFRGGFAAEDADAVLAFSQPTGAPFGPDVLQALLDKSLLRAHTPEDLPDDVRLGMLESVKAYAAERLAADPELHAATVARHRAAVLARCDRLAEGLRGTDGLAAFRRLALEADNLAAALAASDGPETTVRAALLLQEVLGVRGPADEHRALLDDAIEVSAEVPAPMQVRLRIARARGRRRNSDAAGALADGDVAAELARPAGGVLWAEATFARGLALHFGDRTEEAIGVYEESVRLFEELNDVPALLRARPVLAFALWHLGRRDEAEPLLREALRLVGDRDLLVYGAGNLARVGLILGARGRWEEALELVGAESLGRNLLGSRRGESLVLANLSVLESARGRLDEAVSYGEEALAHHPDNADPIVRAVMLRNLGLLEADRGDHGRARELLTEALQIHARLRDALGEARVWTDLGELALLTGSRDEAVDAYVRAADAAQEAADPRQIAIVQACRAVLDHVLGDEAHAAAMMDAALLALEPIAGPRLRGCFAALAGAMAADRAELERAAELLDRAGAVLGPLGDRTSDGTLKIGRALFAKARAAAGADDRVRLQREADRTLAALAAEHDDHELSVPRLLLERARDD